MSSYSSLSDTLSTGGESDSSSLTYSDSSDDTNNKSQKSGKIETKNSQNGEQINNITDMKQVLTTSGFAQNGNFLNISSQHEIENVNEVSPDESKKNYNNSHNLLNNNYDYFQSPSEIPEIIVPVNKTYSDSSSDDESDEEYQRMIMERNKQQAQTPTPLLSIPPPLSEDFMIPLPEPISEKNTSNDTVSHNIGENNGVNQQFLQIQNIPQNFDSQSSNDFDERKRIRKKPRESGTVDSPESNKNIASVDNFDADQAAKDFGFELSPSKIALQPQKMNAQMESIANFDNEEALKKLFGGETAATHISTDESTTDDDSEYDDIPENTTPNMGVGNSSDQMKITKSPQANIAVNTPMLSVYVEKRRGGNDSNTPSSSMTSSDYSTPPERTRENTFLAEDKFLVFRLPEIPQVTNEMFDNEIEMTYDFMQLLRAIKI